MGLWLRHWPSRQELSSQLSHGLSMCPQLKLSVPIIQVGNADAPRLLKGW